MCGFCGCSVAGIPCDVHSTLFKHTESATNLFYRWLQIVFDVVFVSVVEEKCATMPMLMEHHRQILFFPFFFIWFSLILHTMRMLSDILTIAPMYLVSRIMRRHSATAHCGFWIQFQCIINMECTVYVWQRSDDTKRYRISAHSLAPCVCVVFVFTPKPICEYTKYL